MVEWNFGLNVHKIKLKISEGTKNKIDWTTGWVKTFGLIWSVNEIEDFRNRFNNLKYIYIKNLVRDWNPASKKWIHIKMLIYIFMVPEIFNFIDWPN